MATQLGDVIGTLEQRVEERTRDLDESARLQRVLIDELEERNAELETARDGLVAMMHSKDQFLGSVSHELRTPLTSVVGFSEELRDRYGHFDDEQRRRMIATVADQGQEMAGIINDLLVAARADLGEVPLATAEIDLIGEIRTVVDVRAQPNLQLTLPAGPALAFADAARVRQIMRNLVGNSVRYGGSSVEVRVECRDGEVSVQVRDDGAGLPRGEWEEIFEPYYSAHQRRGQPESVGLGLTVSRMLARRMNGDLTYRYERGQSVFELTLPAATNAARSV
jgi:signal transduction histidine kinase